MKSKLMSGVVCVGLIMGSAVSLAGTGQALGLSPAVVEQLKLANTLIAMGDARNDPLLLIAAAKLQKNLGAEAASLPVESVQPQEVLARAKTLASHQKDIYGLAVDVESMKSKGWDTYCRYCTSSDKAYYGIH